MTTLDINANSANIDEKEEAPKSKIHGFDFCYRLKWM
jgi:hypothetical protein